MKQSAEPSAENKNRQINRSAEYSGGSVGYSILEGSVEHNPILIIPGFTGGRTALSEFANALNKESGREVIYSDQPVFGKQPKVKLSAINHQAEAILAIIKTEGMEDIPFDVITHSFGSMIAVKAAELAKEQGIMAFDTSEGSHTIFIAPGGTNDRENLAFLGGRWVKFLAKDTFYRGQLDPTGEMSKAGVKNFWSDPSKTAKEILALRKKDEIYAHLGDLGLKPFILGFANDSIYPHKVIENVLQDNAESLSGYAVPVDSGVIGAANFKSFVKKSGLSVKEAKEAWAHHYRNANHADLQYHPERTVKAILQIINR